MASTAGAMIDETLGLLQSWSLDEEQSTTLAGDITASDTSLTVTTARGIATGVSPGIIEIDSELLYCDSVSGTTATVVPWGRGYKHTTAAAHTAGARVVSQPTFPRAKVLDAMNEVLQRVFPMVFAVKNTTVTASASTWTYGLPDDAQWLLNAKWLTPGGRGYWRSVNRWRMSPVTGGALGSVSVDIADAMVPGQTVDVLYAAKPGAFTAESDDFETATSLHIGMKDVVVLGAASSLTTSQELSRLQVSSVEQQNRSQLVAPSAALTSSRYLEDRYQTRLAEERRTLQRLYPPRVTGGWK